MQHTEIAALTVNHSKHFGCGQLFILLMSLGSVLCQTGVWTTAHREMCGSQAHTA